MVEKVKTGECYFRSEDGSLWLAESYVDEDGNVTTQDFEVERVVSSIEE